MKTIQKQNPSKNRPVVFMVFMLLFGAAFMTGCSKEKEAETAAGPRAACNCPQVYDPVCGCDGNTYGNGCMAACAGVAIRKPGKCGEKCVPKLKPGCYCPAVYQPVCGCDGKTYGNACEAACVGVDVAGPGQCGKVCGGGAEI